MMSKKLLQPSRRLLRTVVSKEVVKPSSPTPSHLRTYDLSILDRLAVDAYIPLVAFYKSMGNQEKPHQEVIGLKKSLSYILSKYYPFAGRMAKTGPSYVHCNDDGVEFIEARIDSKLSDFLRSSEQADYDQLFPNNLVWYNHNHAGSIYENSSIVSPLAVQINHFACGGIAVATSLSHKVGDASSISNFVSHWATATRLLSSGNNDIESCINPYFYNYQPRNVEVLKIIPERPSGDDCVTKGFIFTNSKLKELQDKLTATGMVTESGQAITNITRAEAITWLVHKCATNAAKKRNSGVFKPTGLMHIVNMRRQFVEKLPETSIGNIYRTIDFPTSDESEVTPNAIIGGIQKHKMGIPGMQNLETLLGMIADTYSEKAVLEAFDRNDKAYVYSFINRFPSYGIDFGWGKPIKVTLGGNLKNVTFTYEAPNGDGIEASVCLEREEMEIFENDPELLSFATF